MLTLLSSVETAFQGPLRSHVTPASSRAAASQIVALDVVVSPDAKPTAAKEELPDYMQSKRRLYPRKVDVMDQIEDFVQEQIDGGLLLDQEKAWQPSDFLPDSQKPTEEWFDEVREIRKVQEGVPDELLLVLIGDMITEARHAPHTFVPSPPAPPSRPLLFTSTTDSKPTPPPPPPPPPAGGAAHVPHPAQHAGGHRRQEHGAS